MMTRPGRYKWRCALNRYAFGVLAASAVICVLAAPVSAATVGTTLGISATVQATCVVAAPSALAFGTYIPTGASNGNTTISVTCTTGTPYNIALDKGANGASVSTRQMKNGANLLNYALTRDSSGGAQNFGETSGTDAAAGTGTGAAVATTVYGQIPAGQFVVPGSYSDTVNVTVSY
jgi:spore coat protein U-like protein